MEVTGELHAPTASFQGKSRRPLLNWKLSGL